MGLTLELERIVKKKTKVELYLREECGDICVMAKAANNILPFYVARFNNDGTLSLIDALPPNLGFKLSSGNRIMLSVGQG